MKTQHISVYWVSKTNEFVSFIGVCEGKVFIDGEWKVRQGTENRKVEVGCLPPPHKTEKIQTTTKKPWFFIDSDRLSDELILRTKLKIY